ncbi:LpqB family beta-propeller domain-containing protein [uncultured Microbacterium sp.]|uniref:Lipoprotein LpqB, beta-propeller domain-containing protein n=1 Tax=uncultured Microbacterium sp. TaxID=191216 RepID=A0A1Y5P6R3_9MICO|nr:LpqB family beta-propeller domain-containing protein [uncultured Microbacterium sp.]SBS74392.1 Lipoprotein LpqB, beta-propeller domain-containing protein [uncultured Microbacterium sp.]
MTRRRATLGLAAALLALLLTACAGLPTTGPVNAGRPVTEEDGDTDVAFVPAGPSPGATPAQIVEGFIAAGSGTRSNWATAQEFLTTEFRATWRPQAGVTIYRAGERALSEPAEDEIVLTIAPEATVDAAGAYEVAGEGEIAIGFRLERAQGEWRIAEAPDGVILDETRFRSVFRSYELMYFDPSWHFLVPDLRWFPTTNAATRIAEALVDGAPSPWLAESVVTAFSADVDLAQRSVPVRSGVAQVSLESGARQLESGILDRMQTQLRESLAGAGIPEVDMLVDDQVLTAEAVSVAPTRIDSRPLVLTDDAFGFLSGTQIEEILGLSAAVRSVDAVAIEVAASRSFAAVQTAAGSTARVEAGAAVTEIDARRGLVGPTIDTEDYIWSVPAEDPGAVVAIGPDGAWHEIADAWSGATRLSAMRISRDGARIAAVVRDGAHPSVWVAGIVRNEDAVPVALSDPQLLAVLPGDGVGLAWGDATTLALSYTDGGQTFVLEQPVGGPGSSLRAPAGITTVAGGNQPGGVRLRDEDGELYVQRGASWQDQFSGVRVLATQQGTPR